MGEIKKVKHVLGISGGKDSAALALYLNDNYPTLDIEYYSCDTGKELDETYQLIDNLENYLGKKVKVLKAVDDENFEPFDYFLDRYGGYLPSNISRWCTKNLKLMPFEKYIAGDNPVVSYVGIRGDEDREGYISKKTETTQPFADVQLLNLMIHKMKLSVDVYLDPQAQIRFYKGSFFFYS